MKGQPKTYLPNCDFSRSVLQRKYLRDHSMNYSNGISLEKMIQRKSGNRFEYLKVQQLYKDNQNIRSILLKKQIEAYQAKSDLSIIKKTKSNLFEARMPELKESKNKKIISGSWKAKKKQRQYRNSIVGTTVIPQKYEKVSPLELKMEIRKVQARMNENRSQNKSTKNLHKISQSDTEPNRSQIQQNLPFKLSTKLIQSQQITSRPSKPRYAVIKDKFQKANNLVPINLKKVKKTKQEIEKQEQEKKKRYHVENILNDPSLCDEDNINFIQPSNTLIQIEDVEKGLVGKKSAGSYCVCYHKKNTNILRCLFQKKLNKRVEIASITKIMTCYLVIHIAKMFRLDINTQKALVSERAARMPGTSAELAYSDILTIHQLLYALMLPSGNDAAVALAEWGGKIIRKYCSLGLKYQNIKQSAMKSMNFFAQYTVQKKSYQKLFITHMNKAAQALSLENTFFANTHGLMNDKSYSTAGDVAILTYEAMKDDTFRQIVGRKEFSCRIFNRTYSQQRKVIWLNTNKLLNIQGFVGVKTGVTPAAGPCLSSMFQVSERQEMIVVVLKVKTLQDRFKESVELLKDGVRLMEQKTYSRLIDRIDLSKENYKDESENVNTMQDQKENNSEPEPDSEEELL